MSGPFLYYDEWIVFLSDTYPKGNHFFTLGSCLTERNVKRISNSYYLPIVGAPTCDDLKTIFYPQQTARWNLLASLFLSAHKCLRENICSKVRVTEENLHLLGSNFAHSYFRNIVGHSFISYRSSSSMWKCDHLEPAPTYNSVPCLRIGKRGSALPASIQDRIFFYYWSEELGENRGSFDSWPPFASLHPQVWNYVREDTPWKYWCSFEGRGGAVLLSVDDRTDPHVFTSGQFFHRAPLPSDVAKRRPHRTTRSASERFRILL